MLSRPLRNDDLGDLIVSFVNWGSFELPSANLEDVEIPLVTLPGGTLPSRKDIETLVAWTAENLKNIAGPKDRKLVKRIREELKRFEDVAPDELAATLGEPSLVDGPGTHFYLKPASPLLAAEIDDKSDTTASALRKMLVGFANTMTPNHPTPAVRTYFRDHYTEDAWADIIDEAEFFTPTEFDAADHHIHGTFDQYGQFRGTVRVYREDHSDYTVAWPKARGTPTQCGPFALNLAYLQGNLRDSRVDPDMYAQVSDKLSRYAGLYIYRDGIRVLPYGNSDFDFLEVEVRRSKSAEDAFFSYRRMFGVLELSRADNDELREKAGREGFADNEAYRQFRDILKNFLYQVAVDFFRRSGTLADSYWDERAELERLDRARQRRRGQVRIRQRELSTKLAEFFAAAEEDRPAREVEELLAHLHGQIETALATDDPGAAAETLVEAEARARTDLAEIIQRYTITRPRGIGLTRMQTRDFGGYENERARLNEDVFRQAIQNIEKSVTFASSKHKLAVDRRVRFDQAIQAIADRSLAEMRSESRQLENAAKNARTQAHDLAQQATASVDGTVQRIMAEVARLDVSTLTDRDFIKRRSGFEDEIAAVTQGRAQAIESVLAQISGLVWPSNGDRPPITHLDEVEALETDVEELRQRADEDVEMIQLGTAMSVINHEFEASINAMRRSLRRFEDWAEANPRLKDPYRDMRTSFEHLDGYLRLFTPLNRRLYRKRIEIAGSEIDDFCRKVFETRLEQGSIRLEATEAFAEHRLTGYPSSIYPVFINLVDNAIWWLTDYRGERVITLDARKHEMIVRDTGPGVPARDRDAIFDSGFSRKPGGSGYGLYISRQVLQREGMQLELASGRADAGAEFVIHEGDPA
jgi:signal transduction histidine kinase